MRARVVKCLLLTGIVILSACKVQVLVPDGGEVQSVGSGTCLTQTSCVHQITDTTFNETFTAVPDNGWVFLRWSNGDDFLCAGNTNPVCVVSNVLFAGDPIAAAVIDSTRSYFLAPIFEELDRQITDTIIMPGIAEFAQPDLFTELTWNDVFAACPFSNGYACSGLLNGWDMSGWTWANFVIVNQVFNAYGVLPPLSLTAPDGRGVTNSTFAPDFFAAGWRPTLVVGGASPLQETQGWIRDEAVGGSHGRVGSMLDSIPLFTTDSAVTNQSAVKAGSFASRGAWFYRPLPP